MRVSCLQENLAKGLSIVGRAVATRSTLPVLSNVLLATDSSRLKLSATNLELGINCWIGAKVEQDGAITVPARLLMDFVNSLPPDRIDMELQTRTQTLTLRCGRYEASIKGIDAQEFPIVSAGDEDHAVAVDAQTLREMIGQVSIAAATDETRPVLTGVLTDLTADGIVMVAADGYRLSLRRADIPAPGDAEAQVIIPARALQELGRISAEEQEPVRLIVSQSRSQAFFRLSSIDLITQLIDGSFPDYKQILPRSHNTRTVLNTAEFQKAVRLATLFARDNNNIVRLRIEPAGDLAPGKVVISATSSELGSNVGELEATIEGPALEIALNGRFLTEVLAVIDSAEVALETSTPLSPGVLRPVGGEDFLHVIMPMHLK
ncbi:MAG TPA: DNA polymerase III subunit beta [Anaerolineae bacterium]|nr:DNA polymerase III subunit beta [Anaerolineae bacterium]HOQ97230.1 DNA polymerase III subunit beta [Anaerolineae bacterium]HPL26455.1 DNA polymerase III subunit beta [Anaerolineae bacterium]